MGRCGTALSYVLAAVLLIGCERGAPRRDPTFDDGVRLELGTDERSSSCCRIFTVNTGDVSLRVACKLVVFDPEGRLVYAGLVPGPPPGQRRSPFAGGIDGFLAHPGRESHGMIDLPVDLPDDTYRAPCRIARWHGAPPL